MALINLNFESKYLRCNNDVTVILPDKPRGADPEAFYGQKKKYKVLWLLHGTFGDHTDWYRHTNIELYACEKDCIVVMPSAINTNYCDWPSFGAGYFLTEYLVRELMPLVHNWFPASDRREDNLIGGLSMGSRGAIKLALEHPEKFGGVIALSAVPREQDVDRARLEALMAKDPDALVEESRNFSDPFLPAFRDLRLRNDVVNAGGIDRYLEKNNLWALATSFGGRADCPTLYCAMGTEDVMYGEFLRFREHARAIGLNAVFVEEPGYKHEWRFWDRYIEKGLEFFGMVGETGGKEFRG